MIQDQALRDVLDQSRDLGLLGPGEVDQHIRHAEQFVGLLSEHSAVLDLGSGGGVPGLVLARELLTTSFTLLDAGERRVAFLRAAVRRLELDERVRVVLGRAETLARRPELRESFDVVVARSFGAPAVTAECGVGFLSDGGRMLVSEPADVRDRWPESGLAVLGLREITLHRANGATIRELARTGTDISEFPRRTGIPARRPVFETH